MEISEVLINSINHT